MKIYIETLGCPKNITDSEQMAGLLERSGHEIIDSPEEADAIIVNTCGFINDAKEESIDRIIDMSVYKENGARLIVSGCLSQRYGEGFLKAMPEIDILLGVNDYPKLPELLAEHQKDMPNVYCGAGEQAYLEWGKRRAESVSYSSYLKIAEGCNNICAYCVIPSIRGPYRSRKEEDIIDEAKLLAASGCRELILVAQDVTAYGIDLYGGYRLADLLKKLCKIEDIHWIRLMYCYEDRITDDLIQTIADEEKICHYLDIPIQHASDKILKSMNRRSSNASIRATIKKLRKAIPDIHIRTTLITGFPGEEKEDFDTLYSFVEEMKFERLGVFAYSKEEGTPAAAMKNQVPAKTKNSRRDRIMAAQCGISLEHNRKQIGNTLEVLVEEQEEDGSYSGRSRYDAPEIDFSVIFTSGGRTLMPGEFVDVKITDAFDYDLVGEAIR